MNWGTIAIGTRIGEGRCDPMFFRSWQRLITSGMRTGDVVLDPACEMPHHFAANWLVQEFYKTGADTLCMVDSDMVFKHETLNWLRDAPGGMTYGTLSALCTTRRHPYSPVLLRWRNEEWVCHNNARGDGVFEVDAASLAFCLIRRSVFDVIEAKYKCNGWFFDWGAQGLGEDTQFSFRAKTCLIKLGVHLGVKIGHRGMMTFGWDNENLKPTFSDQSQLNTFGTSGNNKKEG